MPKLTIIISQYLLTLINTQNIYLLLIWLIYYRIILLHFFDIYSSRKYNFFHI